MRRMYAYENAELEYPLFFGGLVLSVWIMLLAPRTFALLRIAPAQAADAGRLVSIATHSNSPGISSASTDDLLYDHLMNRASTDDLRGYIAPPKAPVVSLMDYRYQQARMAGLLPSEPKPAESETPLTTDQLARNAASERQGPESLAQASRRTVRPQMSFESSVYHDL
eukprot:TRINITY_DN28033_c0_g1_i1.p1 TRINITY_DN28033_c0_g1~~TRINITY_DN28033_c0_g1_i1.p1  ORF type:complete len:168 (-),score=48.08 TRINITY_DN28033_c0_g1_i1:340-843(-)